MGAVIHSSHVSAPTQGFTTRIASAKISAAEAALSTSTMRAG